jgi:hypothetical protein
MLAVNKDGFQNQLLYDLALIALQSLTSDITQML